MRDRFLGPKVIVHNVLDQLFGSHSPEGSGMNLDEFLATLLAPSDPKWRME